MSDPGRPRCARTLTLLVVSVLTVGVLGETRADAATSLTVTPNTGLSGGDEVVLEAAGFTPFALGGHCQATLAATGIDACGNGTTGAVNVDANGAWRITKVVERFMYVPALERWVDCADPSEGCVMAAAEPSDISGTTVTVPIAFAPVPPPPVTRGSIVVTPDELTGDGNLNVAGSGFRANARMNIYQCGPGATHPSQCVRHPPNFVANASGSFNVSVFVTTQIQPAGGELIDCSSAVPALRCVVLAAEAVDFPNTYAAAPIRFVLPPPVVAPGEASVIEGDTGTTTLLVPVGLSRSVDTQVTVEWETIFVTGAPGSQADPATDYVSTSGTITFAPQGNLNATVPVEVRGDLTDEPDEYLMVRFHDAVGATIGGNDGIGFGNIVNDDRIVVVPGVGTVVEGDAGTAAVEIPLTLSKASASTITVEWDTLFVAGTPGNPADPSTDYVGASGTATIAAGETGTTVSVNVNGDTSVEPDEYLIVSFHDAVGAQVGGFYGLGFGGITDDD